MGHRGLAQNGGSNRNVKQHQKDSSVPCWTMGNSQPTNRKGNKVLIQVSACTYTRTERDRQTERRSLTQVRLVRLCSVCVRLHHHTIANDFFASQTLHYTALCDAHHVSPRTLSLRSSPFRTCSRPLCCCRKSKLPKRRVYSPCQVTNYRVSLISCWSE